MMGSSKELINNNNYDDKFNVIKSMGITQCGSNTSMYRILMNGMQIIAKTRRILTVLCVIYAFGGKTLSPTNNIMKMTTHIRCTFLQ